MDCSNSSLTTTRLAFAKLRLGPAFWFLRRAHWSLDFLKPCDLFFLNQPGIPYPSRRDTLILHQFVYALPLKSENNGRLGNGL